MTGVAVVGMTSCISEDNGDVNTSDSDLVSKPGDETDKGEGLHTIDEQISIIAENKSLWYINLEFANDVYKYMVTDLDCNGRLEIVMANEGGTGLYTYTDIYEVNDTFTGLNKWTNNYKEGDSQLDIIVDEASAYFDTVKTGASYYVFEDLLREMPAYYTRIGALVFKDGAFYEYTAARKDEIYNVDGQAEIKFYDRDGHEITESEYNNMADKVFSEMTDSKYTVKFGWRDVSELEGAASGSIKQRLADSYKKFSVEDIK